MKCGGGGPLLFVQFIFAAEDAKEEIKKGTEEKKK